MLHRCRIYGRKAGVVGGKTFRRKTNSYLRTPEVSPYAWTGARSPATFRRSTHLLRFKLTLIREGGRPSWITSGSPWTQFVTNSQSELPDRSVSPIFKLAPRKARISCFIGQVLVLRAPGLNHGRTSSKHFWYDPQSRYWEPLMNLGRNICVRDLGNLSSLSIINFE